MEIYLDLLPYPLQSKTPPLNSSFPHPPRNNHIIKAPRGTIKASSHTHHPRSAHPEFHQQEYPLFLYQKPPKPPIPSGKGPRSLFSPSTARQRYLQSTRYQKRPRSPVRLTFLTACIILSLQMSSKRTQRAPMDPGTAKHHPFSHLPPRRLRPRPPPSHSPSPSPFRKSCPTRPSPSPHPHSRPHPSPL